MNAQINKVRILRNALLEQVKDLSPGQLNKIPVGFNNNIIWHIGHLTAAMQSICYIRGGEKPAVDIDFFECYKPGSKPTIAVEEFAIDHTKQLLFVSLDKLDADVQAGCFKNYAPFTTRYGVPITDILSALDFLPFHEGLHFGYILAMKKLV